MTFKEAALKAKDYEEFCEIMRMPPRLDLYHVYQMLRRQS